MQLIRVINKQAAAFSARSSILIDKLDRCQGNFTGYAQRAKQPVYVPKVNPLDTSVKGYIDLAPSDEVLLSASIGVIAGLVSENIVSVVEVSPALIATPTLSAALWDISDANLTLTGTVFQSVDPDETYVILTNASGQTQTIQISSPGVTSIVVAGGSITGTPTTSWKAQVKANSKLSAEISVTTQA